MTRLYIVRHAEAESNAQGFMAGHENVNLTTKGEQQAIKLAQELSSIKFAAAFSSDLARAKRTAEIVALEHELAVKTTDVLRERFWGPLQGEKNSQEEIAQLRQLLNYFDRLTYEKRLKVRLVPDMENDEELISRFVNFLRQTALAFRGKNVLIVSHSNAMRTLLVHLGFCSHQELPPGAIHNTGYFVLESDGIDFFIRETRSIYRSRKSSLVD